MAQSLVKNVMHLVFSTKHRQPFIKPLFESELYAYLGGICNNLECQTITVGGHLDHVHILCLLSKKLPLIKVMEELKSHSSKWMKTKHPSLTNFYWQNGYGAFSVDQKGVDSVIDYITNQKEHHRKKTFQEEFRTLLETYDVDYDERYVWD